ncbi:MAG: hypothetical protein ACR2KX_06645 [Chitinophagaceae bacterium]
MSKNKKQKKDKCFCYDTDKAVKVVRNNIPKALRKKYSKKEIYFILEAEFDYMNSIGMVLNEKDDFPICDYPVVIDETKMKNYIGDKAIKKGILTNNDELYLILEAELIYFEMNGALQDEREYLN